MINDNGIAWMIAGGTREESRANQREILHRMALAESRPSRADTLRRRIVEIVSVRPDAPAAHGTLSTDCCPA